MKIEQKICLECGFCCDGTLFLYASLKKGESGNLPYGIEKQMFINGDCQCFHLPCHYFQGKCSIYNDKKPDICSAFNCQLLIDFYNKTISYKEAITIVRNARTLRDNIFAEFFHLSSNNLVLSFKDLIKVLIENNESGELEENEALLNEVLIGKCNVLEALLIKHFRSPGEFMDLMDNNKLETKIE